MENSTSETRKERAVREKAAAESRRKAKIKGEVLKIQTEVVKKLNFLVDIGSYKTRSKYLMSDKEMEATKSQIIRELVGKSSSLHILTFLQRENEAKDPRVIKGKTLPLESQAETLIKELNK